MSQPWAALFPCKHCPKGCVCDTQGSRVVAGKNWSCQLLLAKLFSRSMWAVALLAAGCASQCRISKVSSQCRALSISHPWCCLSLTYSLCLASKSCDNSFHRLQRWFQRMLSHFSCSQGPGLCLGCTAGTPEAKFHPSHLCSSHSVLVKCPQAWEFCF